MVFEKWEKLQLIFFSKQSKPQAFIGETKLLEICWFEGYLCDRCQYVKIKNVVFKKITLCSCVPQSFHLGPLLL